MHAVTAILRRTLLQHIPVAVEGIGTLRTVRSGPQFLPGQRLEPPRRMPELIPLGTRPEEEVGVPLLEAVAAGLAVDPATADGICHQWREEAFAAGDGQTMWLEGIGTIAFSDNTCGEGTVYYPDPSLLELLNPLPAEPLVIPSPLRHAPSYATAAGGDTGRQGARRTPEVRPPKGRNPHNYTVSFVAVLVALAALGYVCYYLWAHTDLLAAFLPR